MSQAQGTTGVLDAGFITEDLQYPPRFAPNQAPQELPDFFDSSGLIFSMYLEGAEEEDRKMAENWKADGDGILVFAGLFSAAVASLISVSIQDIRPNPQDISNFYLANIYQTVADPNRSNISSSLPSSPPPFSPPKYAVWVNALWFMSLVISISCALLAALLQQWARRYLRVTQPRYGLHKRARIRTFFFEAVVSYMSGIGTRPTLLLHVSLFLFLAGLVLFLWNVNLTISKLVLSWVSVCTTLYGLATVMPIQYHGSSFYTPLTIFAWNISFQLLRGFSLLVRPLIGVDRGRFWFTHFSRKVYWFSKTVEEIALNSPKIDSRALMRTFNRLDEDHELERFFSGLPGFRSSNVIDDPLPGLNLWDKERLSTALIGLFDRTFSSDLLLEPVKKRRAIICAKALDPAQFPFAFWNILRRVMSEDQHNGLQTAEVVRVMRGWGGGGDQETALLVRAIFTSVVARAQRRDDSWLISAPNELGIPEADLRHYATDGDSSSLSSLIDLTRYQFEHYRTTSWPVYRFSKVLEAASEFNVQDTSPDLQHKFCALWNQILLKAQNDDNRWMAFHTLKPIRNVYISLHQGTDSSPSRFSASTGDDDDILRELSSYPLCNVTGHIHDDSTSTTSVRTVPYDHPVLAPAALVSPDAPSSPVPTPLRVDEILTTVPPLGDDIYSTTGAMRDVVTSTITAPHYTPDTSTSTPPSPTSPPAAVSPQHNADFLTPSDPPSHPSSTPSKTVLDNVLPTGPPLSSNSPTTRSDLSPSCPDLHRSIIVTTASSSLGPTSAPDLSTVADDGGSTKPSLRSDKDAGSLSVNRAIHADTMTTLGFPPQSLSLLSDVNSDVATIVGASQRAERTGDRSPHPLHCQYDIV